MTNFANNMNEIFGLNIPNPPANSVPVVIQQPSNVVPKKIIGDLEKDFKTTRENIDTFISSGTNALTKVMEMLDNTDHPRWAEAASMLIKTLSDANKEYLMAHQKISEINKNNNTGSDFNIDKAIIYTGTGSEMIAKNNPREENGKKVLP